MITHVSFNVEYNMLRTGAQATNSISNKTPHNKILHRSKSQNSWLEYPITVKFASHLYDADAERSANILKRSSYQN